MKFNHSSCCSRRFTFPHLKSQVHKYSINYCLYLFADNKFSKINFSTSRASVTFLSYISYTLPVMVKWQESLWSAVGTSPSSVTSEALACWYMSPASSQIPLLINVLELCPRLTTYLQIRSCEARIVVISRRCVYSNFPRHASFCF